MHKIVIITGFTGSGKSGLAVDIAKQYQGEIISCDSVQIYKGLDVGSAKITIEEMQGIPHHLIDILNPDEEYSVEQFVKDCKLKIDEIISRNHLPIIVGGTGLYIKALIEGYNFSSAGKNEEFRSKYIALSETEGKLYVWNELNKISPELASKVHYNNLKRVIRYLEIATFGNNINTTNSVLKDYNTLLIGVIGEREVIYNRINNRVDEMINQGLEQEVRRLLNKGYDLKYNCMNSIGYKEMIQYINGEIDYNKCVQLIKQHTRNYCKRQNTFMKTIPNIQLYNKEMARDKIKEFLDAKTK